MHWAPGIPHALFRGGNFINASGALRREIAELRPECQFREQPFAPRSSQARLALPLRMFPINPFPTSRVELTLDANLLPSKVASPNRGDAADPATNGTAPQAFVSFARDGRDLMNQRRCV